MNRLDSGVRDFTSYKEKKKAETKEGIDWAIQNRPWHRRLRESLQGEKANTETSKNDPQTSIDQKTLDVFKLAKEGELDAPYLQDIIITSKDDGQVLSKEIQVNLPENTTNVVTHVTESGKVTAKIVAKPLAGTVPTRVESDFFQKYVSADKQKVAYFVAEEGNATFRTWDHFLAQFRFHDALKKEVPKGEVREIAAMFRAFIRFNAEVQEKLATISLNDIEDNIDASMTIEDEEGNKTHLEDNHQIAKKISLGDAWTKMNVSSEGLTPEYVGPEGISFVVNDDKVFLSLETSAGSNGEFVLIPPGGAVDNKDKTLKKVISAVNTVTREMGEEHGIKAEDMTVVPLGETALKNKNGKDAILNYYASYSLVLVEDDNEIEESLKEEGDEQVSVGALELGIWELVKIIDSGYKTRESHHQVDDRIVAGLIFALAKIEEVSTQLEQSNNDTVLKEITELSELLHQR